MKASYVTKILSRLFRTLWRTIGSMYVRRIRRKQKEVSMIETKQCEVHHLEWTETNVVHDESGLHARANFKGGDSNDGNSE
jgi:hypothetical protein